MYRSVNGSYVSPLPPAATVSSSVVPGSSSSHSTAAEAGYPEARTFSHLFPLRLNFTGTELPPVTRFNAGNSSIGCNRPLKLNNTFTLNVATD